MTKKASRLTTELLEMAEDQRRLGLMDEATYEKITMRHLGKSRMATAEPLRPEDICKMRERARMSQAVFAHHLNVTTG